MESLRLLVNRRSARVDFIEGEIDIFDMILSFSGIKILKDSIEFSFSFRRLFLLAIFW